MTLDELQRLCDERSESGRYYDALKKGELNEVEPIIGPAIIGRGAICDAVEWPNNLPTSQK